MSVDLTHAKVGDTVVYRDGATTTISFIEPPKYTRDGGKLKWKTALDIWHVGTLALDIWIMCARQWSCRATSSRISRRSRHMKL